MSKYLVAAKNLLEGIGEDLATVFGFLKKHEAELSAAANAAPVAGAVLGQTVDALGRAVSVVVPPVGAGVRAAATTIETASAAAPAVVATVEHAFDAFGNCIAHEGCTVKATPDAAG